MFASKDYVTTSTSILVVSMLLALTFFALQEEWLIWRGPLVPDTSLKAQHTCKEVKLYYWQQEQLKYETVQQVWVEDEQQNLQYLINKWLAFLHDEEQIAYRVHADTVMLSPSGSELFISCDCTPFSKEHSIERRLQFIKALCATLKHASNVQQIHLLVKHQPLCDPHLDFEVAWSVRNLQK
jgi:hypothetical protein